MIVSVSRRTDIPAFFCDWFLNRLEEGFVLVRNPMNPTLVSKVYLTPETVDGFVFWTRNPAILLEKLRHLKEYHYYFLITITAYGSDLEKNLPAKEKIIDSFKQLSRKIGRERVIWRYDPILLTERMNHAYHFEHFQRLAAQLESYSGKCIISFFDMYNKCKRNLAGFQVKMPDNSEMLELAGNLCAAARKHGMEMAACAEEVDFSGVGILPNKCIDDELIARISGREFKLPKDKYQRKTCRCVQSVDIGAYNTCLHNCLYCYANSDQKSVQRNVARHDSESPLLFGRLNAQDRILERAAKEGPFLRH